MDAITQPDNLYVMSTSLDNLHRASKNWISELKFWADELNFFKELLGRYFSNLVSYDRFDQTQAIYYKIFSFEENNLPQLIKKLMDHEKRLANTAQFSSRLDEEACRIEHQEISRDLMNFMREMKSLKKDVFAFTESVINDEKLHHLMPI